MKTKEKFSGIFTAIVTPFKEGRLDENSLARLVNHQVVSGVHGFVVSGTTGESPVIDAGEKKAAYQVVRENAKGRPIIFGTGTNCTKRTIEATEDAENLGADAALVVVPYYNKPPQRGLAAHFRAVAQGTKLPVILYNVPSRTVTGLTPETVQELSRETNIVGIKEATGDIELARKIRQLCGKDFLLSSGDDGTWMRFMEAGGDGVISVVSHIMAEPMRILYERFRSGDMSCLDDYDGYQQLISLCFSEANPIPIKAALKMMGLIETDELRLPLVSMEEKLRLKLKDEMIKTEVLQA